MKKEFVKIGVALLLLIGIAVPLSLHREKKIQQMQVEDEKEKFINFELGAIKKIKVINKLGEVEMIRRKKDAAGKYEDEFGHRDFEFKETPDWLIVAPYRAIADKMVVESLYEQIKDVRYQKIIQETQELKKDYELDPAVLTLQFFKDDTEVPLLSLEIGAENNAATSFYYAASDKPGIYLGERALQPFRQQNLQEWREKRILGFSNVHDLEKIKVNHVSNQSLSFEATREKSDWIIGPIAENLAGDGVAINEFLMHIDGMRASQILDDESILKNTKFLGDVVLKIKNKDSIQYKIYAGPKGSEINYVQRSDVKSIFMIAEDSMVLPTFQDMVSKKLLSKGFANITSMKITLPKFSTEVVKDKNGWVIQKPVQDAANVRRLESIVKSLSDVRPMLYLKNKTLNAADQKVKIEFGLDDQSVNVVTLYQQGKEFFAKVEDQTKARVLSLYKIPDELYEHMSRLRNTDLVPVTKDHVNRIVFSSGKAKVEIEQGKKRQGWYLSMLENVPASVNLKWKDQIVPEEFFDRVSEMYLVDFHDEAIPSKSYEKGLLEIYTDNGQFVWKFGDINGELIEVYSPDRKVSGTLPTSKFNDLSVMLDEPAKK